MHDALAIVARQLPAPALRSEPPLFLSLALLRMLLICFLRLRLSSSSGLFSSGLFLPVNPHNFSKPAASHLAATWWRQNEFQRSASRPCTARSSLQHALLLGHRGCPRILRGRPGLASHLADLAKHLLFMKRCKCARLSMASVHRILCFVWRNSSSLRRRYRQSPYGLKSRPKLEALASRHCPVCSQLPTPFGVSPLQNGKEH